MWKNVRSIRLIHFVIYPLLTVSPPNYHLNDTPIPLPLTFPRVAKRDYECNAIIVCRKYDRKFEFIFATEFQRTFLRPINLIPFFNCISDNKYTNK